jgi:hypothetical protein
MPVYPPLKKREITAAEISSADHATASIRTSTTSESRSVGIVRSQTQATEFYACLPMYKSSESSELMFIIFDIDQSVSIEICSETVIFIKT